MKILSKIFSYLRKQYMPADRYARWAGVTVGRGSLIASGSVVCKSVPDNEVWGGVPAKFICTVEDYIRRNLPFNLDTKGLSAEEKRSILLSLPDDKFIKK